MDPSPKRTNPTRMGHREGLYDARFGLIWVCLKGCPLKQYKENPNKKGVKMKKRKRGGGGGLAG